MRVTAQVTYVVDVVIDVPEELQNHLVGEGEQKWADEALQDFLMGEVDKKVTCPDGFQWVETTFMDEAENTIADFS